MSGLKCSLPSCSYSTDSQVSSDTDLEAKMKLLRIHADTVHAQSRNQVSSLTSSKAKLDPPRLSTGADQQTWDLFQRSWQLYKSGMGITEVQQAVHLFNCLYEDLRSDVLRANPEKNISDLKEQDLLESIKTLVV